MKKTITLFISFIFSLAIFCQKDSTYPGKNRLPYHKYKGMQFVYVNLTGFAVLVTPSFDNEFLIELHPTYAYYFSKRFEGLARYQFGFLKYGSLSRVKSEGFNQFSIAAHYYPFRNINFLYAEAGFRYGNYALEKNTRYLLKEWNLATMSGIGIEVITKKRVVITFNAALVIPFDSRYNFDFVRSAGIGFQLDKR